MQRHKNIYNMIEIILILLVVNNFKTSALHVSSGEESLNLSLNVLVIK